MRYSTYPEKQFRTGKLTGKLTANLTASLSVSYKPGADMFTFMIERSDDLALRITISTVEATRLAGYILSKHRAIGVGDAIAFSSATRACDAIPVENFTVIPHGHELLAATEKQDAKDDDQDMKVTVTSPGPESAKRAGKAFAEQVSNVWFDKESSRPKAPDSATENLGLLHPDQERRLTALREAAEILPGFMNNGRLLEWADWILYGRADTGKED